MKMNLRKIISLLLFILIISIIQYNAYGFIDSISIQITANNNYKSQIVNSSIVSNFNCLEIDSTKIQDVYTNKYNKLRLEIRMNENDSTIYNFKKVNVLGNNFKVKTSSGKTFNYHEPVFYQCKIGNPNYSMVNLTVFKNSISAMIMTNQGNIMISRSRSIHYNGNKQIYTMFNDNDLLKISSFICGSDDFEDNNNFTKSQRKKIDDRILTDYELSCIDIGIYFECDFSMYQALGSNVQDVVDFVTGFFNSVNQIYSNEDINTYISDILVWTESDNYDHSGSTNEAKQITLLRDFSSKRTYFKGHYAQLLSMVGSPSGGRGWILDEYFSGSCDYEKLTENPPSYDLTRYIDGVYGRYSFSDIENNYLDFPTYSWTVQCVTHELGHNFGSHHTQWCGWYQYGAPTGYSLDNCWVVEGLCQQGSAPTNGGTIMSYCHMSQYGINFNNGFGQYPGEAIRQNLFNSRYCLASSYFQDETIDDPNETVHETPINIYSGSEVTLSKSEGDYIINYSNQNQYGNIVFSAGNAVILKDGFKALNGSKFTASININLNCFGETFGGIIKLSDENNKIIVNEIKPFSENNESLLKIIPIPAVDKIEIIFPFLFTDNRLIKITNIFGVLVAVPVSSQSHAAGQFTAELDVSAFPSGVYFCVLHTPAGAVTKQFVVVH
ncbi:MAG: hypothetical protein HW421_2112 [Ignavibacteria bacterium]|nr:hypothetical protein [Ignavibacteria bacterium]